MISYCLTGQIAHSLHIIIYIIIYHLPVYLLWLRKGEQLVECNNKIWIQISFFFLYFNEISDWKSLKSWSVLQCGWRSPHGGDIYVQTLLIQKFSLINILVQWLHRQVSTTLNIHLQLFAIIYLLQPSSPLCHHHLITRFSFLIFQHRAHSGSDEKSFLS